MKYKTMSAESAKEAGFPLPKYEESWEDLLDGKSWHPAPHYVVQTMDDGTFVAYIGSDGGEPEDQTLYRNWYWVAEALQAAYEAGHSDGQKIPSVKSAEAKPQRKQSTK